MKIPNLYLPGFPKCASTSMAYTLASHPDIALPSVESPTWRYSEKEPRWFSFWNDTEKTLPHLETAYGTARYRLDATPDYIIDARNLERIREHTARHCILPRFIVMLRDPIDRIESRWNHYLHLKETEGFERVQPFNLQHELSLAQNIEHELANGPADLLGSSNYALHIERLLKYFTRDRILFIHTEDFKKKPADTMGKVRAFLDLPDCKWEKKELNAVDHTEAIGKNHRLILHGYFAESQRKLQSLIA